MSSKDSQSSIVVLLDDSSDDDSHFSKNKTPNQLSLSVSSSRHASSSAISSTAAAATAAGGQRGRLASPSNRHDDAKTAGGPQFHHHRLLLAEDTSSSSEDDDEYQLVVLPPVSKRFKAEGYDTTSTRHSKSSSSPQEDINDMQNGKRYSDSSISLSNTPKTNRAIQQSLLSNASSTTTNNKKKQKKRNSLELAALSASSCSSSDGRNMSSISMDDDGIMESPPVPCLAQRLLARCRRDEQQKSSCGPTHQQLPDALNNEDTTTNNNNTRCCHDGTLLPTRLPLVANIPSTVVAAALGSASSSSHPNRKEESHNDDDTDTTINNKEPKHKATTIATTTAAATSSCQWTTTTRSETVATPRTPRAAFSTTSTRCSSHKDCSVYSAPQPPPTTVPSHKAKRVFLETNEGNANIAAIKRDRFHPSDPAPPSPAVASSPLTEEDDTKRPALANIVAAAADTPPPTTTTTTTNVCHTLDLSLSLSSDDDDDFQNGLRSWDGRKTAVPKVVVEKENTVPLHDNTNNNNNNNGRQRIAGCDASTSPTTTSSKEVAPTLRNHEVPRTTNDLLSQDLSSSSDESCCLRNNNKKKKKTEKCVARKKRSPRNNKSKQQKEAEMAEKRLQRENERAAKQREKEAAKELRERERKEKKEAALNAKQDRKEAKQKAGQAKGKFANQEVVVLMEPALVNHAVFDFRGILEEQGYQLHSYPSALACLAVQWIRRDFLRGGAQEAIRLLHHQHEAGGKGDEEIEHFNTLVVIFDSPHDFIGLLQGEDENTSDGRDNIGAYEKDDDDYPKLESWLLGLVAGWRAAWKKTSADRPRIFLILYQVQTALDKAWVNYNLSRGGRNGRGPPPPNAEQLHDAILWMLIQFQIEVVHCEAKDDVAKELAKITRFLANARYQAQTTELACIQKLKAQVSDMAPSHERAVDCWIRQLQQLPRVSAVMARSVVQYYPTAQSLYQAYQDPNLTVSEKHVLVANCFGTRTSQIKISQMLYRIFTSVNPQELLS